jgi:hypothetical protein
MDKIKLIFYNTFQVGDSFIAQPFVKNVVDNNGNDFEYYYYLKFNYYPYECIQNIRNIQNYPSLVASFAYFIKQYGINNSVNYIPEHGILLINTWIATVGGRECDPIGLINAYKLILNNIKTRYSINIKYNDDITLAYPSISLEEFDITAFIYFKTQSVKKIVFLNNYKPTSGQKFILHTCNDYIEVIQSILNNGYIVLLPESDEYIRNYFMTDVYFCGQFINNYPLDGTSKELYHRLKLCNTCDYSIYFDSGRNFLYFNREFIDAFKHKSDNNIKLQCSVNDSFYNNLTKNEYVPDNYSTNIIATCTKELIVQLNAIFRTV